MFDGALDPDGALLGVLLGGICPEVGVGSKGLGVGEASGGRLEGAISDDDSGTAGLEVEAVGSGTLLRVEDGKREDDAVPDTLRVLLDPVKDSWVGLPSGKGGTLAPSDKTPKRAAAKGMESFIMWKAVKVLMSKKFELN